jgi:magnesium-transporting ATPase (P-type)
MENTTSIFDNIDRIRLRRRQLLPWWIKICCWFFMLFGILGIICLLIGLFGFQPDLSLYGFETHNPYSITGLMIIGLGLLKGITSYALWFEKDFAVKVGIIDAIVGILICIVSMTMLLITPDAKFTFRLELILLIPYLIKLVKIESKWKISIEGKEGSYIEGNKPFIE